MVKQRASCFGGRVVWGVLFVVSCAMGVMAQEPAEQPRETTGPAVGEDLSPAAARVDVNPVARDDEIQTRLQTVLEATDWFENTEVRVENGVVFLSGQTESQELKRWAGDLARNTQDVVAVANRMVVPEPAIWDFRDAWSRIMGLWRDLVRALPFVMLGLLILLLSLLVGMMSTRGAQVFFHTRIQARLLRNVISYAIGAITFLIGVYIVLRVSGLTQLALTVVGGTGLIGLILGIAFREITENFLASIFLSMQQPFEMGDLIEVAGVTGFVQQLNVRVTILMTLNGNVVQIPNSAVYKSTLRNFTTNANRREDFAISIGYDVSISHAQEIARQVLEKHPAILNDPEPWVLVESLGPATVTLRVFFWLNGREFSDIKVRSSVIRSVKRAFQESGISMVGGAREMVFSEGIPVKMIDPEKADAPPPTRQPMDTPTRTLDEVSTKAEAGLYSEAAVIEEQARQVHPLKSGENLLPSAAEKAAHEAGSRKGEG